MNLYKNRKFMRALLLLVLIATLAVILYDWWAINQSKIVDVDSRNLVAGRLFGFIAAWSVLIQVLLMARTPVVEENLDLEENLKLHKYNGWVMLAAIFGHMIFLTLGYSAQLQKTLIDTFVILNTSFENVLLASIGVIIFFLGVFLSFKVVKKHMNYELWYFTHLLIYGAILMTFLHQVATGVDFADNFWFTAVWYGLYAFVFLIWGWYRLLRPLVYSLRYNFQVESVKENGAGTYTVTLTGRNIDRFEYKSGQYATWRILAKNLWFEAHPFSINSRAGQNFLQFTFKSTANYADRAMRVKPGTKVLVDGPRGNFTIDRSGDDNNVVLIAGGIGLAPYISTIGPLIDLGKNVTLLYSVKNRDNVSFIDALSFYSKKGLNAQVYIDSENSKITDEILTQFAKPDTTVYICGPQGMSVAFASKLQKAGLPAKKIITERFSF